ncbi:Cell envelope-related transcriptional attenuator domain-containing protein [Lentibacillus persicus]|uniref:Cell envelope-related transcriptional attenuator domain-containing protein n=1 Tax=Lentibacillus persicus TaxID=640948 RepID=A0A1I1X5M6_9BACI|nr:LCP family protein [Lentibacillus persicus]SFE02716.1 Cell envelope-related transcriptional attenuator domain-containing protein [Lentibacillus persicus]
MDDKFKKEVFSYLENGDLTFTEEDRIETLNKIQNRKNQKQDSNKTLLNIGKHYAVPVLGSVTAVILAIVLLLPNLNGGNVMVQENERQASQQEVSSFSVLLMGKNSAGETNRRSHINIVLTYNSDDNSMNVVSIPHEARVDIYNSEGEIIDKDKLMHASAYEPDPAAAVTTVSNLLDIPIDYYASFSEEQLYQKLGIGREEVQGNRKLMSEMGDLIKEQLSASDIKELLEESSQTNMTRDSLNQLADMNVENAHVTDMAKGAEETIINDVYYIEINQHLLEKTSNMLKNHLNNH